MERISLGDKGRARENQQSQELIGICAGMRLLKFFQLSRLS